MIASCLIPSRDRIGKLFTAIHCINNSCFSEANVEILIRLDDDDEGSLKYRATLEQFDNVKVITGSRMSGYTSVGAFYTELAAIATGDWCWFLLDDCLIGGRDFDLKFRAMPLNVIVQPEISRLGGSTYMNWPDSNFPAVPRNSWRKLGVDSIGHPADTWMSHLYRQHGWKTRFLKGITGWHLMHQEHG